MNVNIEFMHPEFPKNEVFQQRHLFIKKMSQRYFIKKIGMIDGISLVSYLMLIPCKNFIQCCHCEQSEAIS